MQAVFRLRASELDATLIEKIKTLFQDEVMEITVGTQNDTYQKALDDAIRNAEQGDNLVQFSGEEFDALAQKLSAL